MATRITTRINGIGKNKLKAITTPSATRTGTKGTQIAVNARIASAFGVSLLRATDPDNASRPPPLASLPTSKIKTVIPNVPRKPPVSISPDTQKPFSAARLAAAAKTEKETLADTQKPFSAAHYATAAQHEKETLAEQSQPVAPIVDTNNETPATTTVNVTPTAPQPPIVTDKTYLFDAPLSSNREKFVGVVPLLEDEKPKIVGVVSEQIKNGYAKNCLFFITKIPAKKYKVDYYKIYRKDMLKESEYKMIRQVTFPILEESKKHYAEMLGLNLDVVFSFSDTGLPIGTSYAYKIEAKYILKSDEELLKDARMAQVSEFLRQNASKIYAANRGSEFESVMDLLPKADSSGGGYSFFDAIGASYAGSQPLGTSGGTAGTTSGQIAGTGGTGFAIVGEGGSGPLGGLGR